MLTYPSTISTTRVFTGVTALLEGGLVSDTTVAVDDDGLIRSIGEPVGDGQAVDAAGLLLLPGIIDLHGDAFERAVQPRQGAGMALDDALREDDHARIAAGITTTYISATDSFEPGLRSRGMLRQLMALMEHPSRLDLLGRVRLHVRHEVCMTAGHDELLTWMATGRVHLLSTADHLPTAEQTVKLERYRQSLARRCHLDDAALQQLLATAGAERPRGQQQEIALCQRAGELGIPVASHDDDADSIAGSLARGIDIAEFPLDLATARRARAGGAAVLMGAPNWIRGGSHLGLLSVAEALAHDMPMVDALCSDYHYPSLFLAPFRMAACGVLSFERAWAMVSRIPAGLARLSETGRIAPGCRADLLLVELLDERPRLRGVWVGGRENARWA
jgi:alpha-D-ribose 1-methylphosphonate 5-triphosphate diphosphatase